jgi:hypothetical protein
MFIREKAPLLRSVATPACAMAPGVRHSKKPFVGFSSAARIVPGQVLVVDLS